MSDSEQLGLAEWVSSLREELTKARDTDRSASDRIDLAVEAIEVELTITSSREVGGRGGVKFWVVEAGADVRSSRDQLQRVRLTLRPMTGGDELKIRDDLGEVPE